MWGELLARLLPEAYQALAAASPGLREVQRPAPLPLRYPVLIVPPPPGGGLSAAQTEPSTATRRAPTAGVARSGAPLKERSGLYAKQPQLFEVVGDFWVGNVISAMRDNIVARTARVVIACDCDADQVAFSMAFAPTMHRIFEVMTDEAPEPRRTVVNQRREEHRCAGLCLHATVALLAVARRR
jgi:hypothetical protein